MRTWTRMIWTDEQIAFLTEHYPMMGKGWCVREMGIKESQVRNMASRLGLRVNPDSQFMKAKNARHAEILTGRKRPEQAEVMRQNHRDGKMARSPETNRKMGEATKARFAAGGHPRGALGMKHTEATLAVLSAKSRTAWASKTEDEIAARTMKQLKTKVNNGTLVNERHKTTWKGGWRQIGAVRKYYRSRWEANYARYLEWLRVKGMIASWEHEPETFWFDGIKRGCVSYLPDFRVTENDGRVAYHEVKGWMDDRSKTKIARMARYHPDVELLVIREKQYKAIANTMRALIADWEE